MARIRTVKPDLFRHEDLHDLELETGLPVRLAFIGLFCVCDKAGRFRWRPKQLKLDIFPYDDLDFERVIDALASRDFLVKYEVEGVFYGCIPTFTRHQHINNRESESTLPDMSVGTLTNEGTKPESPEITEPEQTSNTELVTREPRVEHSTEGEKEREKEREGERNNMSRQTRDQVKEVFDHWITTMGKTSQAKLTDKRKKCIEARLKEGYTVDQIKQAIEGCAKSPHHMGQNDSGTVYDDLTLICRSGDKVEQFANNVAKFQPTYLNGPGTETLEQFESRVRNQADRASAMIDDLPD